MKVRKAVWIGPDCEAGFVTKDKLYSILSISKSGHYDFTNNFGTRDCADSKYFKLIRKSRTVGTK